MRKIMSVDCDTRIIERIKHCKIERRSYEIWLKTLKPANFFLVGIGGTFSLIAGMLVVTGEGDILFMIGDTAINKTAAGWLAIIGAVLTGFHKRLKCESYQNSCLKLANQFAELETLYECLLIDRDEQERQNMLISLEKKLSKIRLEREITPSDRSIRKAEKSLRSDEK